MLFDVTFKHSRSIAPVIAAVGGPHADQSASQVTAWHEHKEAY
jgi:hypothetical protein